MRFDIPIAAALAATCLAAAAAPTTERSPQTFDSWREVASRSEPQTEGCFKATYPSLAWQSVPCASQEKVKRWQDAVARNPPNPPRPASDSQGKPSMLPGPGVSRPLEK